MTNTGINVPKACMKALMQMFLQWRHLKMLKRGGRGHTENGVETTECYDLAIQCLSCLRPGVNLPEGWENAPVELR